MIVKEKEENKGRRGRSERGRGTEGGKKVPFITWLYRRVKKTE